MPVHLIGYRTTPDGDRILVLGYKAANEQINRGHVISQDSQAVKVEVLATRKRGASVAMAEGFEVTIGLGRELGGRRVVDEQARELPRVNDQPS